MKLLLATLLLAAPVAAQEPVLPDIVSRGFDQLVSDGPDVALDTWLYRWTSPEDAAQKTQLKVAFQHIWSQVGQPQSWELVRVNWIGERIGRAYAVLVHDFRPIYLAVRFYNSPSGWHVTAVNANSEVEDVFPASLIDPGGGGL